MAKMKEGTARHTFRKTERLCSHKLIEELFAGGKSIAGEGLRLIYIENELSHQPPVSILIAVSKKNLKTAVSRNRAKRLIREAYRLHNQELKSILSETNKSFNLAFVYTSRTVMPYCNVETAIINLLDRFIKVVKSEAEASRKNDGKSLYDS